MKTTKQYKAIHVGSKSECVYTNLSNEEHIISIDVYLVILGVSDYKLIGEVSDNWYDDDGDIYKYWRGDLVEMIGYFEDYTIISMLLHHCLKKDPGVRLVEENFLNNVATVRYFNDEKVYESDEFFVSERAEEYRNMVFQILSQ
jgi:hypothetical protein